MLRVGGDSYSWQKTHIEYYNPSTIKLFSMLRLLILATLSLHLVLAEVLLNCQNNGIPSQTHCICPPNFVGSTCQLPAEVLSPTPSTLTIDDEYTYFYYEPTQVNFYRLNFTICMHQNPSNVPLQFFISTEKVNGSLQALPAFFQTYKLLLAENGCTNFTSHYISIKRREDNSFRRIIVGMKTMRVNATKYYFNLYKSSNITEEEAMKIANNEVADPLPQKVSIKMEYELYLQTSYEGSFIILVTSLVLMSLFVGVVSYVKKKYTQVEDFTSYRFTQEERYYSRRRHQNPEYSFEEEPDKNDLTIVHVFMPATTYGSCSKYYNPSILRSCTELPEKYPQFESCSICLVDFDTQDEVRTTPCRHRYHKQCIDNWCETNLSCPICRRRLDFNQEFRTIYLKYLRGELDFAI